jgi:hypothetical protein
MKKKIRCIVSIIQVSYIGLYIVSCHLFSQFLRKPKIRREWVCSGIKSDWNLELRKLRLACFKCKRKRIYDTYLWDLCMTDTNKILRIWKMCKRRFHRIEYIKCISWIPSRHTNYWNKEIFLPVNRVYVWKSLSHENVRILKMSSFSHP